MTDSASDGMDDFMEALIEMQAAAEKKKRRESKAIQKRPSEDVMREGIVLLTVEIATQLLDGVAEGMPNVTEAQRTWLEAMKMQVEYDALNGKWDV